MFAGQLRWALNNVAHSDNPTCTALETVSPSATACNAVAASYSASAHAATIPSALNMLSDT